MDRETSLAILAKVRTKQADISDANQAAVDAAQRVNAAQLQGDAFADIRNIGLASLGVGLAGRGAVGLLQVLKRGRPKKQRNGPALLPLPYPAEAIKTADFSLGNFFGGGSASTKSGIPYYGPAMLGTSLAGLGLGWKGMDAILDARRKAESQKELEQSRQEFHDALLSQYNKPLSVHPSLLKKEKKAGDDTMVKVGEALDRACGSLQEALTKEAFDWSNAGGQLAGGYGMYAGLSGLLTGALVYDKTQKRSRRAILDKAMQRRQRRRFMQSPTEIYAVPEPVQQLPHDESPQLLHAAPDEPAVPEV